MNPSDYVCCPTCGKMCETKKVSSMRHFLRTHICYNHPEICTRPKPLVCRICPYPPTPFCRPFHGKETMYACRACIKQRYGLLAAACKTDQYAEEVIERPSQSALALLGPPYNGAAPPTLPQGQSESLAQALGPSLILWGPPQISSIGMASSQPSASATALFGQTNAAIVVSMRPHNGHVPWGALPQVNFELLF